MKRFIGVLVVVMCALVFWASDAVSGSVEADKMEDATAVLKDIQSIPESGIPPILLENAYGIAVIPNAFKAGFVVGGRYGWGVMSIRLKEGGWSPPCFVSLKGGSVGFQIGVQSTDVILVFKTSRSIDQISRGKFTLGGDASIAAGPVGRSTSASTDVMLKAEIYSYSRSRGLFAGISLEGAVLEIDYGSTRILYNQPGTTIENVLSAKGVQPPPVCEAFRKVLTKYAH